MRKTKIVWSLAALIVVVLGGGVVAYAQLGPSSPVSRSAQALTTTTVPSPQSTTIPTPTAPTTPTTIAVPSVPKSSSQAEVGNPPATKAPTTSTTIAVPPVPKSSSQAEVSKPPAITAPAHPATPVTVQPKASSTVSGGLYVIQPHDTLWAIAASRLGNPYLWTKIYALNQGRSEPGGRALTNPNLIYPGWTIVLPVVLTSTSAVAPAASTP